MSEFDDMLRAGAISPGSQPHVESKKPTPTGEGLPTATVTITHEARTSSPTEVDHDFVRSAFAGEEGRIFILCADPSLAPVLRQILSRERLCQVEGDVGVLEREFAQVRLVVADADCPGLDRAAALPLPLIVLAYDSSMRRAREALQDAPAVLLGIPFMHEEFIVHVRGALAGGQRF